MIRSGTAVAAAAIVLAATCLAQQDPPAKPDDDPYASLPPKRAALERLLSERATGEAFEAAVKKARDLGVGEQAILEARFLYHVDRREDDRIAAMLPDFLARKDRFRLEESEIFALREDWLAVVEYVQAIDALLKNDKAAFKKHITEAFWLSPRQGSAFAPHIERLRLEEAMRAVKITGDIRLQPLGGDAAVKLSTLMAGKKATLLHFWSPWSRECEDSMPDFRATAAELLKHEVAVISILAESGADAVKDAAAMIAGAGAPVGAWLVDRDSDPLARKLRIQNLPSMVLLSQDGSVLFNGHPSEDGLWSALSRIAPDVARPAVEGH